MPQNYKLFELLSHIPKKELANLRKLLVSPFFVRHQKTIELFDYLVQFHPHFSSPELSRQSMYEALHPNKQFNSQQLRDVMSFLVEAVEHFLVFRSLQEQPNEYTRLLYAKLAALGMQSYLEKNLQKTKRELQQEYPKGLNTLFYNFETETRLFRIKEDGSINNSLRAKQYVPVFEAFMKWLYPKMLEQALVLCSNNSLYESGMFSQTIPLLQQMPFPKDGMVIEIYHKLLALQLNKRAEDYADLKDFFLHHQQQMELELQMLCVGKLFEYLNFAAINTPHPILNSDDYLLWKQIARELEIRVNGVLSPAVFYNGAVETIRRNQQISLSEYIKQYAPYLPAEKAQNGIVDYVWAIFFFKEGDYDRCLDYLSKIAPKKLDFLRFEYRALLIRVFFEKREFELAAIQLDSFRHYIKDEELPHEVVKLYWNFYRIMVRLVKLYRETQSNKAKAQKARKLLQYLHSLSPKPLTTDWLIKKINQFIALHQ